MKKLVKIFGSMLIALTVSTSGIASTAQVSYAANCDGIVINPETGEYVSDANSNGIWDSGEVTKATTAQVQDCTKQANDLSSKIMKFVKIISTLVIVFAVGMIVYGGFKYITSQGDPRQAEGAKTQIWYAGVGLFIVLAAFTILQLYVHASGGTQ